MCLYMYLHSFYMFTVHINIFSLPGVKKTINSTFPHTLNQFFQLHLLK